MNLDSFTDPTYIQNVINERDLYIRNKILEKYYSPIAAHGEVFYSFYTTTLCILLMALQACKAFPHQPLFFSHS